MTGKVYLDETYGLPRGNGKGLGKILDEFGKIKTKEEFDKILPTLKLIKQRAKAEYVKHLVDELIKKIENGTE